jgi:uncharacterized protein involved in exopolysaccharide biosynthesis
MSRSIQDAPRVTSDLRSTILNIKVWFHAVLRNWWVIGIAGLLAGLLGYWMAYKVRPKYESHLTFALDDGGESGGGGLAAELGLTSGGSSNIFSGDNITVLLTSRRIIERVLLSVDTVNGKAITMAEYYRLANADSSAKKEEQVAKSEKNLNEVSFPVGQPRNRFSYLQDSVLRNMYKDFAGGGLKVSKPDKRMNMYDVSVTSYNERFSKVFTDKLINEAINFYIELRTQKSKATLQVLEERVAQAKGSLNSAISSRAAIQDANVNPAFQQAQAQLQQKQVDISTYSGAYGEMYKNLETARYQYLKDIPLLQIIDAADYPMTKVKKSKLKTAAIYAFVAVFSVVLVITIMHVVRSELDQSESVDSLSVPKSRTYTSANKEHV